MSNKILNSLFLIFIIALPFSWANIGSMSIYRLVTIFVFSLWIILVKFKIYIPNDNRRKFYFSWIFYVFYSIIAFVMYPSNTKVVFGMILLLLISLVFFFTKINYRLLRYTDYMWLGAALFFIFLFIFGGSGVVGDWGTRKTLVILGTMTDANEFSSFFVIALPIALFYIMHEKGLILKIICSVILAGGFYVVFMAGSRAALLSVVLALIITIFLELKPSPKTVLLLTFLVVFLLIFIPRYILPLIPEDTLSRLSLAALKSDNGSGRMDIWIAALQELWNRNPFNWFFGCGYGGLKISYFLGVTSTMHNQYLQQLVSYGIVGLLLYLRLFFLAYKQLKVNYRKYIGAFIGLAVMAMTLTMGPSYKILWILFFMAGLGGNGYDGK